VPLPGIAILIVTALMGAWISDGPLRGRRWPPIYFGAVVMLIGAVILKVLPLYQSISGHYAIYWLINMGVSKALGRVNDRDAFELIRRPSLVL
jgi:dipeptide/tripeptide permease